MRITFISSHRYKTYDYYKKRPMPICEIKLNQLIHKNPEPIIFLVDLLFNHFFENTPTFQPRQVIFHKYKNLSMHNN